MVGMFFIIDNLISPLSKAVCFKCNQGNFPQSGKYNYLACISTFYFKAGNCLLMLKNKAAISISNGLIGNSLKGLSFFKRHFHNNRFTSPFFIRYTLYGPQIKQVVTVNDCAAIIAPGYPISSAFTFAHTNNWP